jgi:hypothetical protein
MMHVFEMYTGLGCVGRLHRGVLLMLERAVGVPYVMLRSKCLGVVEVLC